MAHRRRITLLSCIVVLVIFVAACAGRATPSLFTTESVATSEVTVTTAVTTTTVATSATAADILAENKADHATETDSVWEDAVVTQITLHDSDITVDGEGVTVDGNTATITAAGTYRISGTLTDGQILVDTEDEEVVRLILDGVTIGSLTNAPLAVMQAEKTIIILADNTENYLADSDGYVFANPDDDEPNATLFSKSALTIAGNGALTVDGQYNDGIASKDGLIIASGTITVNAADDGIRGKDYLIIKEGTITVNAQGDGFKADNEEDADRGYIAIESGVIAITAGGDAMQAETDLVITGGEFTLTTGGGSTATLPADLSAKGLKSAVSLTLDGGTFTVDAADDAIHTNTSLVINGGSFTLATGDDAIHADVSIEINGGDINITQSYEGIESAIITLNEGNVHLVSSDDGINAADGSDTAATNRAPGQGGGRAPSNVYIYLNGGYLVIDAGGDGIDSNGFVEMTDGIVIVNGPTMPMNSALDYDGTFTITGGLAIGVGSSRMAQTSSASSSQYALLLNFTSSQPADTLVHIQSSAGEEILTFAPAKEYQSLAFTSPELVNGETYTVFLGGSATGTATDGLYPEGSYTPGTEYTSFTVSSIVTTIGATRSR